MLKTKFDQKKERYEIANKAVNTHNKPIVRKIGVIVFVAAFIVFLFIKFNLSTWLEVILGIILLILFLSVQYLAESIKSNIEFDDDFIDDESITDEKWFAYLIYGLGISLIVGIIVCQIWSRNIYPQLYFWIFSVIIGIIVSLISGQILFKKEPSLKYELSKKRIQVMGFYYLMFLLLGILLTHALTYQILNSKKGEVSKAIVKIESTGRFLFYEDEWHSFSKFLLIKDNLFTADSVRFEVVRRPPLVLIKNIRKLQNSNSSH